MMKNERLLSEMARERILRLMNLAKARTMKMGETDELSKRYVRIAREMKEHYGLREANSIKNMICKTCGSVIVPGMNAKVRMSSSNGYRAVICSRCGTEKHLFYK